MHTYKIAKEYPTGATRYRCPICDREVITRDRKTIILVEGENVPHFGGIVTSGEVMPRPTEAWRGFLEGLQ